MNKYQLTNLALGLLALPFLGLFLVMVKVQYFDIKEEGNVLAEDVQVGGVVPEESTPPPSDNQNCIVRIQAKPQRRLNNDLSTILTVEIYQSNSKLGEFTATTNTNGDTGFINVCDQGIELNGGTYNFKVRGYSHLFSEVENTLAFVDSITEIDATEGDNVELIAGETSLVFDNYINSLDLSTQINDFYDTSLKSDLNKDDFVNSLDISITMSNLFTEGE